MSARKLLRLSECAERTGHRVCTWRAWILDGKVPYYKVGGSVRVAEGDLEEFIQAGYILARANQRHRLKTQEAHA